jgi:hypothetical protein
VRAARRSHAREEHLHRLFNIPPSFLQGSLRSDLGNDAGEAKAVRAKAGLIICAGDHRIEAHFCYLGHLR